MAEGRGLWWARARARARAARASSSVLHSRLDSTTFGSTTEDPNSTTVSPTTEALNITTEPPTVDIFEDIFGGGGVGGIPRGRTQFTRKRQGRSIVKEIEVD